MRARAPRALKLAIALRVREHAASISFCISKLVQRFVASSVVHTAHPGMYTPSPSDLSISLPLWLSISLPCYLSISLSLYPSTPLSLSLSLSLSRSLCKHGWINGCMDTWMQEWMDTCMHACIHVHAVASAHAYA